MKHPDTRQSAGIVLVIMATILLGCIMAPVAADTIQGNNGPAITVAGWNSVLLSQSSLSDYAIPRAMYSNSSFGKSILNQNSIPTAPKAPAGQVPHGVSSSETSGLASLFSSAMNNYYINPPKPITNPVPAGLTPSLSTDSTWETLFTKPVISCGCGGGF